MLTLLLDGERRDDPHAFARALRIAVPVAVVLWLLLWLLARVLP